MFSISDTVFRFLAQFLLARFLLLNSKFQIFDFLDEFAFPFVRNTQYHSDQKQSILFSSRKSWCLGVTAPGTPLPKVLVTGFLIPGEPGEDVVPKIWFLVFRRFGRWKGCQERFVQTLSETGIGIFRLRFDNQFLKSQNGRSG